MKSKTTLQRDTIQITVNGKQAIAKKGKSILEACRDASTASGSVLFQEEVR